MITVHSFILLCAKCFQVHDLVSRRIKSLGSGFEQTWVSMLVLPYWLHYFSFCASVPSSVKWVLG